MGYDFDKLTDRHGTDCMKFDFAKEMGIPEENLSLWVADMDFETADCITQAVVETAQKGIFGYTGCKEDYYRAVQNWYLEHFSWETEKEWIVQTPGVVFAVAAFVRAFTKPGEKVMIQQPVYYPFAKVVKTNGRIVVNNPLTYVPGADGSGGRYEMDFADMEEKLKDPLLKLFILCSPHNPVGRVWTKEELIRLEELCLQYDVLVVSDEIHSDFIWKGTHHILASLDSRYQKNTVICTAPSKTFNLAGLQLSNIFIPDPELRQSFQSVLDRTGIFGPNQLAFAACKAAYNGGGPWLDAVKAYIRENIAFTAVYLEEHLPAFHLIEPEGTYLLWIDCRSAGMTDEELNAFILHKAHLWLDDGSLFGKEGEGFERINAACPRAYLKQALDNLARAWKERGETDGCI